MYLVSEVPALQGCMSKNGIPLKRSLKYAFWQSPTWTIIQLRKENGGTAAPGDNPPAQHGKAA